MSGDEQELCRGARPRSPCAPLSAHNIRQVLSSPPSPTTATAVAERTLQSKCCASDVAGDPRNSDVARRLSRPLYDGQSSQSLSPERLRSCRTNSSCLMTRLASGNGSPLQNGVPLSFRCWSSLFAWSVQSSSDLEYQGHIRPMNLSAKNHMCRMPSWCVMSSLSPSHRISTRVVYHDHGSWNHTPI